MKYSIVGLDPSLRNLGTFISPNARGSGTDNTTTRFYAPDGANLSLSVLSQSDWDVSTFECHYNPLVDGTIHVFVTVISSITLRSASYIELEELI